MAYRLESRSLFHALCPGSASHAVNARRLWVAGTATRGPRRTAAAEETSLPACNVAPAARRRPFAHDRTTGDWPLQLREVVVDVPPYQLQARRETEDDVGRLAFAAGTLECMPFDPARLIDLDDRAGRIRRPCERGPRRDEIGDRAAGWAIGACRQRAFRRR